MQISAFLQRVAGGVVASDVSDFEFIDMLGDGRVELVAAVDYSGREFFDDVLVVSRNEEADKYDVQDLDAWNLESLHGIIRDLNGDGRRELVVPVLLTPYLGARPIAVWYRVYGHDRTGYVDADKEFTAFYKNERIPRLQQKIADLQTAAAPQLQIDTVQIELDKANRTTNENPKAGFEAARTWAHDSDPIRRVFAVSVLSDIGGPESRQPLLALVHDSDPLVRNAAQAALTKLGE